MRSLLVCWVALIWFCTFCRVLSTVLVTAKVTNGATGPTIPCTFTLEVSHDNTNWKTFVAATAQLGNSVVTEWAVDLPPTVAYVRSKFGGNTGQSVTVECLGSEWTTLL